jgi:putative transposase
MSRASVQQEWFTCAEFAALNLSGLSGRAVRVAQLAAQWRWSDRVDASGEPMSRKRAGRGGGSEYHVNCLPTASVLEMVKRGLLGASYAPANDLVPVTDTPKYDWAWYDLQSAKTKADAEARMAVMGAVDAARASGMSSNFAVAHAAKTHGVSAATVWNWLSLLKGVAPADRLPALAPRRKGGGVQVDIDSELWTVFKSDFLRRAAPTYAGCYARLEELAEKRGTTLPNIKTLQRRLEAEVPKKQIIYMREGNDALRQTLPAQQRTIADLHAMEAINMDGHKWDVFVRFPAANGQPERIGRAISVCIQDVYSRKMLAWRTAEAETTVQARLSIADMLKKYGVPKRATLDNGMAFASKIFTGGAKTRFRNKIKPEDPLGILPMLGITPHWAKPKRGQSKPIERSFGTLEEIISKHPLCAGAYTGKNPLAKPEDYGSKAVDLHVFEALIAKGMEAYNAKQGRRTEAAQGASFDDAFNASYAQSPVGRAQDEQLRLALLAAEQIRVDKTGAIALYGNRYYADAMYGQAGQRVTVRFDPDNFHQAVHVYQATGEYLCAAPIVAAVGFYDLDAAKAKAKLDASLLKATREAVRLQGLISASELAAMMPIDVEDSPTPQPGAIRPVRARGNTAVAQKLIELPRIDRAPVIDRFAAAIGALDEQRQPDRKFKMIDGGLFDPQESQKGPKP